MDSIVEAINYVLNWLSTGVYEWGEEAMKQATAYYVVAVIKAKIWAVGFAWDVAKIVLANIGLSQYITQAWNHLDSQAVAYLTFFRVPDALNIIIQAYVTRLVLAVTGL